MSDSKIEQKVVEIISGLERLAEPAMQTTLTAVQIGGFVDLITAAASLTLLGFLLAKFLPRYLKAWKESDFDNEISIGIAGLMGALVSAAWGFASLSTLLSTQVWLSALAPELALARALVMKVM